MKIGGHMLNSNPNTEDTVLLTYHFFSNLTKSTWQKHYFNPTLLIKGLTVLLV